MKMIKYGFLKKPGMNSYGVPEGIILYKVKIISETDVYYNISYVGVMLDGKLNKLSNKVTKYLQNQVLKSSVYDIVEVQESWFDKILNLKILNENI